MYFTRFIQQRAALLVLTIGLVCGLSSPTMAQADPYHYSNWSTSNIGFGTSAQPWSAAPQWVNSTNPDQGRAYFCQHFGFHNCQVIGPTDTWVRSHVQCWSAAVNTSNVQSVTGAWNRTLSIAVCPAGFPNAGKVFVQVASIPFSNFSNN